MSASSWLLTAFLVAAVLAVLPLGAAVEGTSGQDPPELGLAVGQAHPDFALPDLEDGQGRLSDFRGRRLLLFHFASW